MPSLVTSPSFLVLECAGSKKVGPGIHCLCMCYKTTKKVPKKRHNSRHCGGKELMNNGIRHISPKMGTHGFRAPEKEPVNLEAQRRSMDSLASLSIVGYNYAGFTVISSSMSLIYRLQHCSK